MTRLAWLFGTAYVLCGLLDVVAEALAQDLAADILRTLSLPLLAATLLALRPRLTRTIFCVLGALLLSWLGDTVGELGFLVKIAFFLLAQWAFIAAFWAYRRSSLLTRPVAVIAYAAVLVGLIAALFRPAGVLVGPLIVYGASLVIMAILGSGLNRWGTIGGWCFMISDALLGLTHFYRLPHPHLVSALVMLSYLAAEALLVGAAVLAGNRYDHPNSSDRVPRSDHDHKAALDPEGGRP